MGSTSLPAIPAKRYFTIGEVGELCEVKPHVLRYWEQEFTQLRPMKRRGNRRYYQHHEVLMIRRIRDLLYEQGFTISGARNKLQEWVQSERGARSALASSAAEAMAEARSENQAARAVEQGDDVDEQAGAVASSQRPMTLAAVREELLAIHALLAEPLAI